MAGDRLDCLRQVYAEQMERDPTGTLAEATDAALTATVGTTEQVQYLHGGRCRGLVARAGGNVFAAPISGFQPAPPGSRSIKEHPLGAAWGGDYALRETIRPDGVKIIAPVQTPGAIATPNGAGWTFPDGFFALVFEPPGFLPAPEMLPVRCTSCQLNGVIPRAQVRDDLRHPPRGKKTAKVSINVSRGL
jgi:hypothetical protein